jgi:hypothetical protein
MGGHWHGWDYIPSITRTRKVHAMHAHHHDYAPAEIAQMSATRDEIVHVRCLSVSMCAEWAAELAQAMEDDACYGGNGLDAEMEIVGSVDGKPARVHLFVEG